MNTGKTPHYGVNTGTNPHYGVNTGTTPHYGVNTGKTPHYGLTLVQIHIYYGVNTGTTHNRVNAGRNPYVNMATSVQKHLLTLFLFVSVVTQTSQTCFSQRTCYRRFTNT